MGGSLIAFMERGDSIAEGGHLLLLCREVTVLQRVVTYCFYGGVSFVAFMEGGDSIAMGGHLLCTLQSTAQKPLETRM